MHGSKMIGAGVNNRLLANKRVRSFAVPILVIICFFLFSEHSFFQFAQYDEEPAKPPAQNFTLPRARPTNDELVWQAASNSTLGFSKIAMINLRHRYDRIDAASLQAYVSGIQFEEVLGVDAETLDLEKPGMPPHSGGLSKPREIACYKSHTNLWSQIVRDRSAPVLILENDGVWDIDLRAIMAKFNKQFIEFLHEINSKPTPGAIGRAETDEGDRGQPVRADPDDPWLSEHWDYIGLGHCFEPSDTIPEGKQHYYEDDTVIPGYWQNEITLGMERVIRRSGKTACATAYAVTHRGAAKMLARSALDINAPIDLIMGGLMRDGQLISYTISPPVIAQWKYLEGIGMGHADSDIHAGKTSDEEKGKSGWDKVWEDHTVWRVAGFYGDIIKHSALDAMWDRIFSTEAPFTKPRRKSPRKTPPHSTDDYAERAEKHNGRHSAYEDEEASDDLRKQRD